MSEMKGRWHPRFVICVMLLLGFSTAPALAKKRLENIPLVWKPTTAIGSGGGVVELSQEGASQKGASGSHARARRIQLGAFEDARQNPRLIAENHEDVDEEDTEEKQRSQVLPVTTRDDVAAWCRDRLGYLLGGFGYDVVEEGGDIVITGEVRRFFVVETNTYKGDIGLKIDVKSADGKARWSGLTNGTAKRFGRSYKAENYYEVLSDSFIDAVQRLVEHPGFVSAIASEVNPTTQMGDEER